MPAIPPVRQQPANVRCRFEMTAADAPFSHEFCLFDLPGCEGCPKAMHLIMTVQSTEDPMKSTAWSGWIAGASPLKN